MGIDLRPKSRTGCTRAAQLVVVFQSAMLTRQDRVATKVLPLLSGETQQNELGLEITEDMTSGSDDVA